MQNKYSAFILLAFLAGGISAAQAGQPQSAAHRTQAPAAGPATLDDAALASFITGRLKQAFKDEDDRVDQNCDSTDCAVVVQ
jgi:hypothetical protein